MKNKHSYTNLSVWQESLDLVKSIYVLTSVFPEDEAKTIIDQLKARVIEIPICISNAMTTKDFSKRKTQLSEAHQKLTELETLLIISNKLNFIADEDVDKFNTKSQGIGMHLDGLIMKFKPVENKKSEF
mgnify:CR=1 FL=1